MNIRTDITTGLSLALFLLLPAGTVTAQAAGSDSVMVSLQNELGRSFSSLKKQPAPAYFLAYQLTDNRAIQASASFGALVASSDLRTRTLDVDLRVGDYSLDDTHSADSAANSVAAGLAQTPMPLKK